jgi:O-antigen/teichoic acid export membrane protein
MMRTVLSTNVVSYARIAQVQAPTLLLGLLTTPGEVGLYKIGTAAGSVLGRIAAPAYASVLPRLSRLWSQGRHDEIRALLRQTTPVAAIVAGAAFALLVVFRVPILHALGGEEATAATTVLTLSAVGFLGAAIVFWYPSLMFAIGRPGAVAALALVTTAVQLGLVVPLTSRWGADGAALALCVTMMLTNVGGGWAALRAMRHAIRADVAPRLTDSRVVGTSLVNLDTAPR